MSNINHDAAQNLLAQALPTMLRRICLVYANSECQRKIPINISLQFLIFSLVTFFPQVSTQSLLQVNCLHTDTSVEVEQNIPLLTCFHMHSTFNSSCRYNTGLCYATASDGCLIFLQDQLGQDMFLVGPPGPLRRHLALAFCELMGKEVEYVSLSRDTTETDLKQRREIVGGTVHYVDQVHAYCLVLCPNKQTNKQTNKKTSKKKINTYF